MSSSKPSKTLSKRSMFFEKEHNQFSKRTKKVFQNAKFEKRDSRNNQIIDIIELKKPIEISPIDVPFLIIFN
jgi:hypothetical protein